jgi:hypothetical protein
LTEGQYNGVLKPNVHFMEIRKDLADIERVLDLVVDDRARQAIVEGAYQDLVASGRYSYRRFVESVIEQGLSCPPRPRVRQRALALPPLGQWLSRAGQVWRGLTGRRSAACPEKTP